MTSHHGHVSVNDRLHGHHGVQPVVDSHVSVQFETAADTQSSLSLTHMCQYNLKQLLTHSPACR